MNTIPLQDLPNQSIAFNVDGASWQIRIYQSINFMCADLKLDGEAVITGVRCFGGIPLMPYDYMRLPNFGNFYFDSDPDWTEFGPNGTQLYYLEQDEIDQLDTLLGVS